MTTESIGRISASDIVIPSLPAKAGSGPALSTPHSSPDAIVVPLPSPKRAEEYHREAEASQGHSEPHASPDLPCTPELDVRHPEAAVALVATEPAKGGKGGEGAGISPPLPASPPFAGTTEASDPPPLGTLDEDEVFSSAPASNPVIMALKEARLHVQQHAPGCHVILCPWRHEHGLGNAPSIYFEPSEDRPNGGFSCPHRHAKQPAIAELLEHLGIDRSSARNKPRIRLVAGRMLRILDVAERTLAATGEHFQSGGVIVSIASNMWGDPTTKVVSDASLIKALAGIAVWEKWSVTSQKWMPCDPPPQLARQLLNAQSYQYLPELEGVARQPYFRRPDGTYVTEPGYDPVAKMYAVFDRSHYVGLEPTEADAHAALTELKLLLEEFHFATEADRSAALCAMLTASIRSSLPLAPAFNISASTPGSGKSYLGKLFSLFAGPGEPLNLSYPTNTDEATKSMLAALLSKPAVISFDDMQTDWVPHGMINRMLTCETVADRILGSSRTVQVGTNSFVMGTGNNVSPIRDMARRVVTVTIRPKTSAPATLEYRGDPVGRVKAAREAYIALAHSIIRAWQNAGRPTAELSSIATFETWSATCRQPLVWLGECDPAGSLIAQVRHDPEAEPLGDFMAAWRDLLGEKPVTLRMLVDKAESQARGELMQAIMELPVIDRGTINRSKLGWYLKRNAYRIIDDMQIEKVDASERNAWRIAAVGRTNRSVATPDEGPTDYSAVWLPSGKPIDPTAPVFIGGEEY